VSGYISLITAILPTQQQNMQLLLAFDIRHPNPVNFIYLQILFFSFVISFNYAILKCADMHLILTEGRGNGAASERLCTKDILNVDFPTDPRFTPLIVA
jgi:hypothetical protein